MSKLNAVRTRAEAHAQHGTPGLAAPADRRDLLAAIDAVIALHRPIKVYDECECPEGTHPEDYEWIDCEDYNGCENSFTHYACEECCTSFDYISEACSDHHTHSKDEGHRCPTIKALEAA
ncbi:hypothetical protein SRABI83_03242 [Arthrobacter sp. Bi83]|uniref:hypothetical protein n=1 Tax=Arthrobacter sp. Bi83 TaxID=2822353 RepID=UPI001D9B6EA0|nr:hypothetical protein [Arthrobacter sp. Bi83]CAH0255875.1 hypothetical protein SRABI83_03242 [Arthrobacter sp. Bi83]